MERPSRNSSGFLIRGVIKMALVNFAGNFDPVPDRASNLGIEALFTRTDGLTRQQGSAHAAGRCTRPTDVASGRGDKLRDERGLLLMVQPTGAKWSRLRHEF